MIKSITDVFQLDIVGRVAAVPKVTAQAGYVIVAFKLPSLHDGDTITTRGRQNFYVTAPGDLGHALKNTVVGQRVSLSASHLSTRVIDRAGHRLVTANRLSTSLAADGPDSLAFSFTGTLRCEPMTWSEAGTKPKTSLTVATRAPGGVVWLTVNCIGELSGWARRLQVGAKLSVDATASMRAKVSEDGGLYLHVNARRISKQVGSDLAGIDVVQTPYGEVVPADRYEALRGERTPEYA